MIKYHATHSGGTALLWTGFAEDEAQAIHLVVQNFGQASDGKTVEALLRSVRIIPAPQILIVRYI